jgi:hypothetical protein
MDIIYFMTTVFYNLLFLILAAVFIFLPFIDFASDLYSTALKRCAINKTKHVVSEMKQLFPYPGQVLLSWRIVHIRNNYPFIGETKLFPSDEGVVNLAFFAMYLFCMAIAFLLMLPWILVDIFWFAPWAIIHVPYYSCVLLVGYFMYQCKILQHSSVSKDSTTHYGILRLMTPSQRVP